MPSLSTLACPPMQTVGTPTARGRDNPGPQAAEEEDGKAGVPRRRAQRRSLKADWKGRGCVSDVSQGLPSLHVVICPAVSPRLDARIVYSRAALHLVFAELAWVTLKAKRGAVGPPGAEAGSLVEIRWKGVVQVEPTHSSRINPATIE